MQNYSHSQYSLVIRQAVTEMEMHPDGDLTLSTLARRLNVSPNYLSALFHRETGETLINFIIQRRISQSLFLLNATNHQIILHRCAGSRMQIILRNYLKRMLA